MYIFSVLDVFQYSLFAYISYITRLAIK